ncbi:methyltransferase family protein [Anaerobacterium chartisolvens]|uniref:Methyltransferase family protein n=2 Tax=Anaerobacterium chartisolvens TaxID=1297424 RepID=A0A369AMX1_9FIRM|nr:methyltransferase family protein [Anaerobacterium chartisolvens]
MAINYVDSINKLEDMTNVVSLDEKDASHVEFIIEQSWIQVANGSLAERINFSHKYWTTHKIKEFILACRDNVIYNSLFRWNIIDFVIKENRVVSMISFSKEYGHSTMKRGGLNQQEENEFINEYTEESMFKRSLLLYRMIQSISDEKLSDNFIMFLKELANGDALITSTLASELLCRNANVTVPKKIVVSGHEKIEESRKSDNKALKNIKMMFEDRIDVYSYNFFEIVHPAYARQCVALAYYLNKYIGAEAGDEIRCIDVGTGPGIPLIMMLEMLPNLKVQAIEPSEAAFEYLRENIKGDRRVNCEKIDFLEMQVENRVPVIMSTGASHHFNTYFFFQKCWNVLEQNGILLVADEFISPFKDCNDRKNNLILHHLSYLLPILFEATERTTVALLSDEKLLIEWFRNYIPIAIFYAYTKQVDKSSYICRNLLKLAHSLSLPSQVSDPLVAFYRLQLLELEALVAGLDYEVEQKTYPERFCKMAKSAGFSMIDHSRVYNTIGEDQFDAGTHVFVFKKNDIFGESEL